MAVDHEFGAQHTELKLSIVESYLKAFTTALKQHFPQLWYIDAFAGTGSRTVRVEAREGGLFDAPTSERVEQRRGSAQIAIGVDPKFDRLVFMDTKPTYCAALRDLADRHQDRDIVVVEGDANRAIQSEMAWDGWKRTRAVMFLDPYGMDVEWATLEAIAATEAIDVWFLFSLSGLYRQATAAAAISIPASAQRSLAFLELMPGRKSSIRMWARGTCLTSDRRNNEHLTSEALSGMLKRVWKRSSRKYSNRYNCRLTKNLSGSRSSYAFQIQSPKRLVWPPGLLITSSRWAIHRKWHRGTTGQWLSCSCHPIA
jgi:three-Cys-motif partner protein